MGAERGEMMLPPRGVVGGEDRDGHADRERVHREPPDAVGDVRGVDDERRGTRRAWCGAGCGIRLRVRAGRLCGQVFRSPSERHRGRNGHRAGLDGKTTGCVGKGRGRHSTHDRFCSTLPVPDIPQ